MSRLASPRHTGKIQVESGAVRSGNHRAPPVARAACTAAQHTVRFEHRTAAQKLVAGLPGSFKLRFRRARERLIHRGSWTQTSRLALNGWQLSLT